MLCLSLLLFIFVLATRSQPLALFPPVARANVPYTHSFPQSYLFPPAASNENAPNFTFTINQSPSWLHFTISNSTSLSDPILTFSGTPDSADAYSSWVRILRSAPEQYTFTRGFRMSVSANDPPKLALPLATQILGKDKSSMATMNSAQPFSLGDSGNLAGIHVPANWSFSIGFRLETFKSSSPDLYYDATVDGGQPRPEWLKFDNRTLTLYGTAPGPSATSGLIGFLPISLNVTIGCTDFPNTPASANDTFILSVSPGKQAMDVFGGVNVTLGSHLKYDVRKALLNTLEQPAKSLSADIDGLVKSTAFEVGVDDPSLAWVQWDNETSTLTGDVPYTISTPSVLRIPIRLIPSKSASFDTTIPIQVQPFPFSSLGAFNTSLGPNLRLGDSFVVDLSGWITGNGAVQSQASACPLSAGMTYDASTKSLKGTIPRTLGPADPQICLVTFSVTDADSHITAANTLNLSLPTSLFRTGTSAMIPTSSSQISGSRQGLSKGGVVAVSVVSAIFVLLGIGALAFFVSRRSTNFAKDSESPPPPNKNDMDFVDIIRDSYSRQYEKYKSFSSRDTTATIVGSGGGATKRVGLGLKLEDDVAGGKDGRQPSFEMVDAKSVTPTEVPTADLRVQVQAAI
ncbi:hypothetical protein FRB99_002859, partial [Tulasnella sp. 403]